jgi:hypothetical protein
VLDTNGFAIGTGNGVGSPSTAVASDGQDSLVVWENDFADWNVLSAARVLRDGTVHQLGSVSPPVPDGGAAEPAVAWNGKTFLVVWTRFGQYPDTMRDVAGTRVSRTGRVLDPLGIDIASGSNGQTQPAVASAGSVFLVVWSDDDASVCCSAATATRGIRLGTGGQVLDPTSIDLAPGHEFAGGPTIASNGRRFLVASANVGVLVSKTGHALNTTPFAIAAPGSYGTVAARGPSRSWAVTYRRFAPRRFGADRAFLRTVIAR